MFDIVNKSNKRVQYTQHLKAYNISSKLLHIGEKERILLGGGDKFDENSSYSRLQISARTIIYIDQNGAAAPRCDQRV